MSLTFKLLFPQSLFHTCSQGDTTRVRLQLRCENRSVYRPVNRDTGLECPVAGLCTCPGDVREDGGQCRFGCSVQTMTNFVVAYRSRQLLLCRAVHDRFCCSVQVMTDFEVACRPRQIDLVGAGQVLSYCSLEVMTNFVPCRS